MKLITQINTFFKWITEVFTGAWNYMFKDDRIEVLARRRLTICKSCPSEKYDTTGLECMVPGSQPCCAACGCSLALKARSPLSYCDRGHWREEVKDFDEMLTT